MVSLSEWEGCVDLFEPGQQGNGDRKVCSSQLLNYCSLQLVLRLARINQLSNSFSNTEEIIITYTIECKNTCHSFRVSILKKNEQRPEQYVPIV